MANKTFKLGDTVRVHVRWTDVDTDLPTEPAVVTLLIQLPDNTSYLLTYGTDPEIEHPSAGTYTYTLLTTQLGTYHWRWTAINGPDKSRVLEGSFDARTTVH